jgi:photosystem II stability/assembly factor-like uncharacterized protein
MAAFLDWENFMIQKAGAAAQFLFLYTLVPLAALTAPAAGQDGIQVDQAQLAGLEWRAIGPAGQGGRVTDVEALPHRPATIYLGTASGGVFKSVNHGITWDAVFDGMENLSVGDIAVSASHPDHVWVGTGEANNRNSSPWGGGVYRSTDGGASWQLMGLEETLHIGRVVIHPTNPNIVYVAAVGHLFGPNDERGIYKTEDGGERWSKIKYIDEHTGFVDLAMDPTDPQILYAAAYQRRRRAFGFVGSGSGGGLYKTTDGGRSWRELTEGLPEGDKGRIGIAVSASRPNIVMAIVQAQGGGVFRSEDRGERWTKVNDFNPRPMYYSYLRIDPNDDSIVYVLGTYMHHSSDGGKTFAQFPFDEPGTYGVGVHVDNHTLWIDPNDSEHLLLGNDGGFYYSFDRGARWEIVNSLPIGQFYDIAVDMQEPYNVYGGLQDNQSVYGPSATRSVKGILNKHWTVSDFGDGMVQQADPVDPQYVYTSSQGGAIIRHNPRTGDRKVIKPFPTDTAETYRFYWTAPFIISPHDEETIYLGGNRLFTTHNRGMSWTVSEDLSRGIDRDSLAIMETTVGDTTRLSRNDGVSSYGEITTISESPVTPGLLWVGTNDGNVQVSRDGGETWEEVSDNVRGLPHPMFVSRVEASHAVEGRAYASFDGHWDDDYRSYAYVTDDYGAHWRRISDGLSSSVRVIREHPRNPNALFAGTDDGVFVSLNGGDDWTRLNNNMPRVPVHDLEIHSRDNDLIAGTHGRSIWVLDNLGVLVGLDADAVAGGLHVSPINPATLFQYKYDVPRLGNGPFRAPNPKFGALVTYFLAADHDEGVTIRVRDGQGRVIRTMEGPGRRGFNRVAWDLRLQPLPMDTSVYSAPNLDVGPRGPFVMAGAYDVEVDAGEIQQTRSVVVRSDPLLNLTQEDQRSRYAFTVALYELQAEEYHAAVQANRIERSANAGLDSLEAREDTPEDVSQRADSLRSEIRSAAGSLRRQNSQLRGWWRGLIGEFDGGPSTQGTMTGPTDDQQRRLTVTRASFDREVEELDRIIAEVVPALNEILRGLGIMEIEVPNRGGADLIS